MTWAYPPDFGSIQIFECTMLHHCADATRLCCHGCWVLLWNPVCGDEDWEWTAGIAGSLWLRGVDDDADFTTREVFAMDASLDLRWSLVDSGHVASVLCLVVPLAGTLVSDSRLRTVGTELEAQKHKPYWTFWAGCVIDFRSLKWCGCPFSSCGYFMVCPKSWTQRRSPEVGYPFLNLTDPLTWGIAPWNASSKC